ncbi:hypothetical protein QRY07_00720 (plasmid) [Bacillus cereus]|uniref:hypothetical protein n=1 Tax=Bacillus cereus TaxID=1396 RepID=UPI00257043F4|nr:hypothetical protein [Bacillus cereus]WJE17866.1 hypothetical protein QRY07_00720 [Bacillus cereus]
MIFTITKKFILAQVEVKKKANLYYVWDTRTFDKSVLLGIKTDEVFQERSVVEVDIDIRIQNEKFDLMNGEKKYKDTASLFVTSIRQVKE